MVMLTMNKKNRSYLGSFFSSKVNFVLAIILALLSSLDPLTPPSVRFHRHLLAPLIFFINTFSPIENVKLF